MAYHRTREPGLIDSSALTGKFTASGGTITTPGDGFKYHTFTTSGSLTVTEGQRDVLVFIVGGGGGGGGYVGGGGGGGGGVREESITLQIGSYTVTVGGGGAGANGAGSAGSSSAFDSYTCGGGGGGSGQSGAGGNGDSGGGGSGASAGGTGQPPRGYAGGTGAGSWTSGGGGGANNRIIGSIAFALPRAGQVRLRVFDVRGRLVRTLVDGDAAAGEGMVVWQGRDDRGHHLADGVYFCRLEHEAGTLTQKLLLVR